MVSLVESLDEQYREDEDDEQNFSFIVFVFDLLPQYFYSCRMVSLVDSLDEKYREDKDDDQNFISIFLKSVVTVPLLFGRMVSLVESLDEKDDDNDENFDVFFLL
jgi:hypothetical protein